MRPTTAEIDLAALRFNFMQIQSRLRTNAHITAVVKANAYGHGAIPVSKAALTFGADSLAVAIPEEGIELRQAGITAPILVLGLTLPEQARLYADYQLTATICSQEHAAALCPAAGNIPIPVMIKIDTGMGRIGTSPASALSLIEKIMTCKQLSLQGLFTHMACADCHNKDYSYKQITLFEQIVQTLQHRNIRLPVLSVANSAGIMDLPTSHYNMVRAGIILYGLEPSAEIVNPLLLKPVMQLKSKIVYIKQVPVNSLIGYGSTYTTTDQTYIATIPIGYADGYNRHFSNRAQVLIGGNKYPVAGKVCMDQIMVDLGPVTTAKVGDEVVLFGCQGSQEITVTELAGIAGTINYELVCAISARIPRIYLNS